MEFKIQVRRPGSIENNGRMAKRALVKMQNSSEAGIIPHKNEIIKYHVELWYNKGHEKGQVTFYSVHEIDKIGFVNAEAKDRR